MGHIRIGISGWRYTPWRGVFYPKGLPQRLELDYSSHIFPSIELNGSFYSLQRPSSWTAWRDATPPDFVFSVKGPRYITHMLRLREIGPAMANFLSSGVLALGPKLGPVLWQFPPNMKFEPERFEAFLEMLPRDTEAAMKLARHHDARMEGRTVLTIDRPRMLRHAVEIRHESFIDAAFIEMLRRHGVALVVADAAGLWPDREDLTADFVYVRLHGAEELYASGYSSEALDYWARRIEAWSRGSQVDDAKLTTDRLPRPRKSRDVYCYFDNDAKVHAPYDAAQLMLRLGLPVAVDAQNKFTLTVADLQAALKAAPK